MLYLLEVIKRTKTATILGSSVSKILSEIDENIHCYVLKSVVSKIQNLMKTIDTAVPTVFSRECYTFEPGFYDWKDLNKSLCCQTEINTEDTLNNFEDAEDAVNQVTKSAKNGATNDS